MRVTRLLTVSWFVPFAAALAVVSPKGLSDDAHAAPHYGPTKALAGYCSATGDYCVGVNPQGRKATFSIILAARYFTRYRLCVTAPRGPRTCRSFPIRKVGRGFGSIVRWEANYPNRGPGSYKVAWSTPGGFASRPLTFRVAAPPPPPPPPRLGTRVNPIPAGAAAALSDGWQLSVVSVTPNANDVVEAENSYNDPPSVGRQFYMLRVRATYTGKDSDGFDASYRLRAVGRSAVSYSTFRDSCGVIPDEITSATVFPGGTIEGNVCWSIRSTDVDSLLMYDETDTKFFRPR